MKRIMSALIKYKLYLPYQVYRFLYFNIYRINIQGGDSSIFQNMQYLISKNHQLFICHNQ